MADVADDSRQLLSLSSATVDDSKLSPATILTAGYGNRGFEGFIELLKRYEVTHFVDVRSVPQSSYWEDFRRQNLERLVPEKGLKYVWMGDTLGGKPSSPSDEPNEAGTRATYDGASSIFCKAEPNSIELQPLFDDPKFKVGLQKLVAAASGAKRQLCLVCGCKRPHLCHRSRLIGAALLEQGVEVLHVNEREQIVTQEQVATESAPQPSLF